MVISLFLLVIIIGVIFMFAFIYAKARKIKEKHIKEAEKHGDLREAERLKNMSDDRAADEFEDEL
jgi:hypothetical protein